MEAGGRIDPPAAGVFFLYQARNSGVVCALDTGLEAMSLVLSVKGPRWAQSRIFTLSAGDPGSRTAWIGRAPECAVVLDDPDRFVSLHHARLDVANGGFWLSDHSTNGTFVNGRALRLAKDERHRLVAGDMFRVGLFEITVQEGSALPGGEAASPLDITATATPVIALDPLAAFLGPAPGAAPARPDDPFDTLLADLKAKVAPAPLPEFAPAPEMPAAAAPANPPPVPPPSAGRAPPSPGPAAPRVDMLDAIAAEVADLSPALRPQGAPAETALSTRTETMDTATAALAAFWCGLGIIPRNLRPHELIDVMAEIGVAFREASDGLAATARTLRPGNGGESNPIAGGHAGLRRHFDGREAASMRLDEAVRDIFARAAERDAARRAATRAGVRRMAESMSASAVEERFRDAVTTRWPRARSAEMWRLFRLMQEDLIQLAEMRFRKEVEERMRRVDRGADESGL
jgi:predicted component of type VI protein secretion system